MAMSSSNHACNLARLVYCDCAAQARSYRCTTRSITLELLAHAHLSCETPLTGSVTPETRERTAKTWHYT
eukprot:6455266-Amphidinium_carterae.1